MVTVMQYMQNFIRHGGLRRLSFGSEPETALTGV